jgi:hypothetical protein
MRRCFLSRRPAIRCQRTTPHHLPSARICGPVLCTVENALPTPLACNSVKRAPARRCVDAGDLTGIREPEFSDILRLLALFRRRLSALFAILALSAGNLGLCAGWMPTPEARMACCANGSGCPMHKSEPQGGAHRTLTQAEADSCCASSEDDNSSQSVPMFAALISPAVLGASVALPPSVPALVLSDTWRIVTPLPAGPIPKHVLLSVFLV